MPYLLPPPEVVEMLDAPPTPAAVLSPDRRTLLLVEYEAYPPMAERQMAGIEAEVRARWPVGEVALVHRLGRLGVGEISVAVAVSAPHRADAFEACRHAIDRLKEVVPIWKKDLGPGKAEWVHPEPVAKNV